MIRPRTLINPSRDAPIAFARRVFMAAGIYGLLVLPPQYFLETRIGRDFPPPITHAEYYYGFLGVALAWQVAFLLVARDPVRYRAIMIPAILEKASFGLATVALFLPGRLNVEMLVAGRLDVILGGLFVAAYMRTASAAGAIGR
jgi:hypothetical protein